MLSLHVLPIPPWWVWRNWLHRPLAHSGIWDVLPLPILFPCVLHIPLCTLMDWKNLWSCLKIYLRLHNMTKLAFESLQHSLSGCCSIYPAIVVQERPWLGLLAQNFHLLSEWTFEKSDLLRPRPFVLLIQPLLSWIFLCTSAWISKSKGTCSRISFFHHLFCYSSAHAFLSSFLSWAQFVSAF